MSKHKVEIKLLLKGKTVVLGVTGSIAGKIVQILQGMLVKQHADVNVMTHNEILSIL